jgi:NADH:ubiquinone oxidoreductase subunit E
MIPEKLKCDACKCGLDGCKMLMMRTENNEPLIEVLPEHKTLITEIVRRYNAHQALLDALHNIIEISKETEPDTQWIRGIAKVAIAAAERKE